MVDRATVFVPIPERHLLAGWGIYGRSPDVMQLKG
jgi:hypothetical protein